MTINDIKKQISQLMGGGTVTAAMLREEFFISGGNARQLEWWELALDLVSEKYAIKPVKKYPKLGDRAIAVSEQTNTVTALVYQSVPQIIGNNDPIDRLHGLTLYQDAKNYLVKIGDEFIKVCFVADLYHGICHPVVLVDAIAHETNETNSETATDADDISTEYESILDSEQQYVAMQGYSIGILTDSGNYIPEAAFTSLEQTMKNFSFYTQSNFTDWGVKRVQARYKQDVIAEMPVIEGKPIAPETAIASSEIEQFCESAQVYGVNSSVWLVDHSRYLATHCSDTTFNRGEWNSVYPATRQKYQCFLQDENWH